MNEIYAASPLEAFQGGVIAIAVMLGIGLLSLASLPFGRRSLVSRVVIVVLSLLLVAGGLVVGAVTYREYSSGSRVLTGRLRQMQIVENNDSEGTSTTQEYRISFAGETNFDVPQSIFQRMKEQDCYQVTYYPTTGLLEMLGQPSQGPPLLAGQVTSIAEDTRGSCP